MKKFATNGSLAVILLVIAFVWLVQSAKALQGINYFDLFTWNKVDGSVVLQGKFYAYEDMSLFLGEGGIAYDCSTGEFYIDEIVDVPVDGVTVNGEYISEQELIDAIAYILSELVVYSETGDYANIFPEYQPDSLYNYDHPSALVNRSFLEGYEQYDHTQHCPVTYTAFLPAVVTN